MGSYSLTKKCWTSKPSYGLERKRNIIPRLFRNPLNARFILLPQAASRQAEEKIEMDSCRAPSEGETSIEKDGERTKKKLVKKNEVKVRSTGDVCKKGVANVEY